MTTPRSFASAAAAPAAVPAQHAIPTGSWTVYFHEPEDTSWTAESYKKLVVAKSWESLGSVLKELGPHKSTNGLLRVMKGEFSPLWENKANIRGGSYEIVGVTISPKKGTCIIKIWNVNAKKYGKPSDLNILHEDVKEEEILYRPHTEQRM